LQIRFDCRIGTSGLLKRFGTVRIVGATDEEPPVPTNLQPASTRPRDATREVESFLWLAAGAAWAIVALRAWSHTKKVKSQRRTFAVSQRLLRQVFPDGIHS
jgi:hypothetical protein